MEFSGLCGLSVPACVMSRTRWLPATYARELMPALTLRVNPVREYLRQTDGRKNRMQSRISVICRVTEYSDCTLSTHNVLLFNVLCRFFEPV